jgi:hypothetical protein
MIDTQENLPITASLAADSKRLSFLPAYFSPRLMMRGENLVYAWLDRLSEGYSGGYWLFYELSNGGFYMAPAAPDQLRVEVNGNGFGGNVSADAAGIIATLFALGQLASEAQGTDAGDLLIDRYHFLLAFADGHAEAGAIFQAVD